MDLDTARSFVQQNRRAVLATRRRDASPQLSLVVAGLDDAGRLMISTRETALKTKNMRRDPRVSLLFFTERFFGEQVQMDGSASIVSLPGAMDLLVDYYRRLSGEHPDWDDYRSAMQREKRVMALVTIERAGPDKRG